MKKLKRILFLIAAFIGAYGFQLTASVTYIMNYDKSIDALDNMLGLEFETDPDGEISDEDIELEGIGRLLRQRTFNVRDVHHRVQRVRALIRKKHLYRNAAAIVTPTQRYIFGSKPKLDAVTQKMIANKELEFTDGFIYYTKEFTTISGNNEVIQSNDKIGVGYSNLLDGGRVPAGMIVAATYFSFLYSDYDSAMETMFTDGFEKSYLNPDFHSAEVEVILNGKVVQAIPVFMMQEFRRFKNTVSGTINAGINLEKPILIKPNDRIQFNLKMPEGVSVSNSGTDRTAVRFVLSGTSTKTK